MIETVMGCNLRCEMCPVPQSKLLMNGRKTTFMSLSTYTNILNEIADEPRNIHLNQMGEPLLNKNICEFVGLAKKDGHSVSLTTNGTLMNEFFALKLLENDIDSVTFSLDGFQASTYEKIRRGAVYDEVRKNIELFCEHKQKLNKKTKICIDCIESDLTRGEIQDMKKYWRNKVDTINILRLDNWAGKYKLPAQFGKRNPSLYNKKTKRYPCNLLWNTIAISAEGNAMYCCHDYCLLSNLPNVNELSLKNIWAEFISVERNKHVENKITSEHCLHCDAWKTRSSPNRLNALVDTLKSSIKSTLSQIKIS